MSSASDEHQCALPSILSQLVNVTTSFYTMAMPRDLMKGFFTCDGFSRSLFNADWAEEMSEFPSLTALLCVSVFLTLIGVIWLVYEFVHTKSYRVENTLERITRLALSLTLLLLLFSYCFFLWIAFMAYLSVNSENSDRNETSNENLRLSNASFETYYGALPVPSNEGRIQVRKIVGNLSKNLALKLESAAPKIIQKGEKSLLAKLAVKSPDLMSVLQDMQEELQSLMAYIMQLSDYARFFYRNTTTMLDLEEILNKVYLELIFKEFEANKQRILMLLNIDNVLEKLREIVNFSATVNNLRQNLASQTYKEINLMQRHLNETVTRNDLEYIALSKNLSEIWTSMQRQTAPKADYYVEPYVNHLELAYCIVALLPFVLTVIYFERFIRRTTDRSFTRYVLMSIISLISTLLILLCIFVILHFLYGATYYNYRREIDENEEFCVVSSLPHCSLHTKTLYLIQGYIDYNVSTTIHNYENQTLKRLCGNILSYNFSPQHNSWLQKLNQQSEYLEEVFRSGAMFDVVKQELYLENWYELHNILGAHAFSQKSTMEQDLLKCNLNMIKDYIFEQLVKRGIVASLLKLTQQSARLSTHLPSSNLTRLIKRVLREVQDLQDFCSVLKKLLQEKTASFSKLLARDFVGYEPTFKELPYCGAVKFKSVGISRDNYMCIEDSLQAFHIGALGILILLFVILLICIYLAVLYEKSGVIGMIPVSSVSRLRTKRNKARALLNRLSHLNRVQGSTPIRKPTQVRFKEAPTVGGNARLKRRYFTPENTGKLSSSPRKVQVKKMHAEPVQRRVQERRRRRKFGLQKYLNRKFGNSSKRRLSTRK